MIDFSELIKYSPIILAIVAVIGLILRFKKKNPKLGITSVGSNWAKRRPESIVTTILPSVLFKNIGEANTTINSASLAIEYKGRKYDVGRTEPLSIMLKPGDSIQKQLIFNLPIATVVIDDDIDCSELTVIDTYDNKTKVKLGRIKKP